MAAAGVAGQRPPETAQDPEADGAALAAWAEARTFTTTRLRPGYEQEEVDALVAAIRDSFLGIREPPLTPGEIRTMQFSTTRLRPGYDEEEVDSFLDEAESRLAARAGGRGADQDAAGADQDAAGADQDAADAAGPATPAAYVPGRGADVPPALRRVLRGYSWIGWGAVFCGWVLVSAGTYFNNLDSTSGFQYVLAAIVPVVLAAFLFGLHIWWSWFLRRPRAASSAMVTASWRGGRSVLLDASSPDGYPSGLEVRLPWWAAPETLLPGESVTCYGRPGGAGRLLVSSSARHLAFTGTGKRRPGPPAGLVTGPDQPAERRFLRWGPEAIFGAGLVAAVTATLIASVPSLTGHLGTGQLRTGYCLTGSGLGLGSGGTWPYMVAAVPCTGPHLAEVFFAGNAWPKSMTAYPGDNAVAGRGWHRCLRQFREYDGTGNSESAFSIYYITPFGDDWSSGSRWLVCLAYQATGQQPGGIMVDGSIKGSGE